MLYCFSSCSGLKLTQALEAIRRSLAKIGINSCELNDKIGKHAATSKHVLLKDYFIPLGKEVRRSP